MNRPDQALEKALNQLGIYTLDDVIGAPAGAAQQVSVEIPVDPSMPLEPPAFGLRTVSPRGVTMTVSDWSVYERDGFKVLAFKIGTALPEGIKLHIQMAGAPCVFSFTDFCWSTGVEPKPAAAPDMDFKPKPGSEYVDIGWYMPARFADQLIDSLGKLNDTFFDGMLQDALIYL